MRDPALHAALRAFAEEAALALAAEVAGGAEVPFELAESGSGAARSRRTPLYCYRPLTGAFIRERLGVLARLPTYAPAARALEGAEGLDAYLRARGEARVPRDRRDRADATLRLLLDRVFGETTDFAFTRAYEELEQAALADRPPTVTLVVGLPGLTLASDAVDLGAGLRLVRTLPDAPPDAAWLGAPGEEPNVLAVATLADEAEADAAPSRLRRLVRALRLYDAGAVGLAPVGWARLDAGAWQLVDLGGSPARPGPPLHVASDQEDELRAFVSLTGARMPHGGELAWALRRFDLACERPHAVEALTDLLLALRALLDPHMPSRLAALCAVPEDRAALEARVLQAGEAERAAVAGLAVHDAEALCEELTEHLRALLGDALCGHLDRDLRRAADAHLGRGEQPVHDG
jgi:hypothetical protein